MKALRAATSAKDKDGKPASGFGFVGNVAHEIAVRSAGAGYGQLVANVASKADPPAPAAPAAEDVGDVDVDVDVDVEAQRE